MKKTKYIIALLVAAISFALPAQAQERILTAIGATGKTELKVANDIKNLYFAGEVLDLDAVTGGYNLQIAWSTGYLAGISAGQDKLFE